MISLISLQLSLPLHQDFIHIRITTKTIANTITTTSSCCRRRTSSNSRTTIRRQKTVVKPIVSSHCFVVSFNDDVNKKEKKKKASGVSSISLTSVFFFGVCVDALFVVSREGKKNEPKE